MFNFPVNNILDKLGRRHCVLGINQYSKEFTCLALGHNIGGPSGNQTRDLDSESDALSLSHHTPCHVIELNCLIIMS